jgi:hypothetical protein
MNGFKKRQNGVKWDKMKGKTIDIQSNVTNRA